MFAKTRVHHVAKCLPAVDTLANRCMYIIVFHKRMDVSASSVCKSVVPVRSFNYHLVNVRECVRVC